jgi:acyl-CoA thioesterase I
MPLVRFRHPSLLIPTAIPALLLSLVLAGEARGAPIASTTTPIASPVLRIMPLGDSITEAWDGFASYRYWLQQRLTEAGIAFDFVGSRNGVYRGRPRFAAFDAEHEGHWGWRTSQVLAEIDGWAVAARPDVVLLHLGTNDLASDPEVIAKNLGAIIDALRRANPDVAVLLARLIPPTGFPQKRLRLVNDAIERTGRERSTDRSPIVIVRHDEGFDPRLDTYDGLHPNESGERKMAERWFDALARLRARPER